ncbi:hypothetical protein [Vreelandella sulfidaeris]|uniref:Uncharacterized protein n=1 Tax=Vreelandella sulfidaeris TaxID=115553 RepID=A0A455U6T3_9GAMM|nr:hypothetical protein HSBAA_29810 [Halomonas sulfidaeris]
MGLEIRGINATKIRLDNIVNRTNRSVYALMEQAAKEMKRRVELQTHLQTGALERSIRIRRLSRAGINGRTSYEVYVDPNARRNVRTRTGIKRQRVQTYAKRLETGEFSGLGKRSQEKNSSVRSMGASLSVGPGFFSRSAAFVKAIYRRKIELAAREAARRG